jgi:hypothetical protein
VLRLVAALALLFGCNVGSAAPAGRHATDAPSRATSSAAAASGIRHVFVIVIENESYRSTYVTNPHHYLGERLQAQGTLLTHYYGIGHYSLDNYLAMVSGQAPNPSTSGDCGVYRNFNHSHRRATLDGHGQAVGTGCIYPKNVKTLPDQLVSAGITWGGFMDSMGNSRDRETARCGVPKVDANHNDPTMRATAADQYAAKHNPFVYFHSLLDSGQCRRHVVELGNLAAALHHVATTPRFTFISPNLCDDGHDSPCKGTDAAGSSAGGLASVDHFLRRWVPRIERSPAFTRNGILIITTDEGADATSCCNEKPGPAQASPGLYGSGGGRTGALVIGKCVKPGGKDRTPYNHYSLLRSLEDIFGITTGGTDGRGHLGFAAQRGLKPFGADLFTRC